MRGPGSHLAIPARLDHTPSHPLHFPPAQNAEILTLTYGSIVRQLISDYEDVDEVNKQLEKMYVVSTCCAVRCGE